MKTKRFAPIAMAALLAVTLSPAAALANESSTENANAQNAQSSQSSSQKASTQNGQMGAFRPAELTGGLDVQATSKISAKKVKVYVLTSVTSNTKYRNNHGSNNSYGSTIAFAYNSKGQLIESALDPQSNSQTTKPRSIHYKYRDGKLISFTPLPENNGGVGRYQGGRHTLVYSKNGRLKEIIQPSDRSVKYNVNKKGLFTKKVGQLAFFTEFWPTTRYTYNKKGRLAKMVDIGPETFGTFKETTKYRYDFKGNLAKTVSSARHVKTRNVNPHYKSTSRTLYKNTYRKDLLRKQVLTSSSKTRSSGHVTTSKEKTTYRYQYKPVMVPKSQLALVESQQWSLLNRIESPSLPAFF